MSIEDVLKAAGPWMQQCGPHDVGLDTVGCACPPDEDPRPIVSLLAAEVEKLRATVERVEALLCNPDREPPRNGTLIVRGRSGGHQDLPYEERVFVRDDRDEGAYPDGDWCPVEGDDQRPWSFSEIHALDDPACDRVSVSLEPYVHVDDIARALAGGAA
jgi:hypothetical protein